MTLSRQVVLFAGFISALGLGMVSTANAAVGFLYETYIEGPEAVAAMPDEKLLGADVEVLIDLEASTTFSRTAGFNQKDYYKFRDLIRYRVRLLNEIQHRKLPVPQTGSPCYF